MLINDSYTALLVVAVQLVSVIGAEWARRRRRSLFVRWTESWRAVLSEVAQQSTHALNRLIDRIPAQGINWQVGLVLMWIGRGAALLVAIFALGIWLFGRGGSWGPYLAGPMALGLAALYLPPALMLAGIGKRAYLGRGDWRWLAIVLAPWVVALAFAVHS